MHLKIELISLYYTQYYTTMSKENKNNTESQITSIQAGDEQYYILKTDNNVKYDINNPNNYHKGTITSMEVRSDKLIKYVSSTLMYYNTYELVTIEEFFYRVKTEVQMKDIREAWTTQTIVVRDSTETIIIGDCTLEVCHEEDMDAILEINNKCYKNIHPVKEFLIKKYANKSPLFNYAGKYDINKSYKMHDLVTDSNELFYASRDIAANRNPALEIQYLESARQWIKAYCYDKINNIKSIYVDGSIIKKR